MPIFKFSLKKSNLLTLHLYFYVATIIWTEHWPVSSILMDLLSPILSQLSPLSVQSWTMRSMLFANYDFASSVFFNFVHFTCLYHLSSPCRHLSLQLLGGSDGQESASNAGDPGLIPGSGRSPGERNGNLLQYSCLDKRSLAGYSPYSPWCCKE